MSRGGVLHRHVDHPYTVQGETLDLKSLGRDEGAFSICCCNFVSDNKNAQYVCVGVAK